MTLDGGIRMNTFDRRRVYPIQHAPNYFHAGRLRSGDQALMGVLFPELVLVRFSLEGECRGIESRPIELSNPPHDERVAFAKLECWEHDLGFAPSTILVHHFFLADRWIGILDVPQHFRATQIEALADVGFGRRVCCWGIHRPLFSLT